MTPGNKPSLAPSVAAPSYSPSSRLQFSVIQSVEDLGSTVDINNLQLRQIFANATCAAMKVSVKYCSCGNDCLQISRQGGRRLNHVQLQSLEHFLFSMEDRAEGIEKRMEILQAISYLLEANVKVSIRLANFTISNPMIFCAQLQTAFLQSSVKTSLMRSLISYLPSVFVSALYSASACSTCVTLALLYQ